MVFFDGEEHEIKAEEVRLANIPKLGTQWKVIFDLKPVSVGGGLLLSLCGSEIGRAGLMFGIWHVSVSYFCFELSGKYSGSSRG